MFEHWNAIAAILWSSFGLLVVGAIGECAIENHINRKNAKRQREWNKRRARREIELAGERLKELDHSVEIANNFWARLENQKKEPIRKATGLYSDENAQKLLR